MKDSNYTKVTYLRPTTTKGARLKIHQYNNYWRAPIFLPYCYATGDVKKQALQYLEKENINPSKVITHKLDYIFITD